METSELAYIERKEIISTRRNYPRKTRPRAKSVDTGNDTLTFEYTNAPLSSRRTIENDNEDDQLTPLVKKENTFQKIGRSYSLDSDPHFQYILSSTSTSWLTSGWSVSLTPTKQTSIVTIFSIWNTIIGSSVLAMPWSIQEAGLGLALILMFLVSSLAVYTAYRLLNVQLTHGDEVGEVPYLCKKLLGSWTEAIARIFSFLIIFGANVIYWVLMSNCLFHTIGFLFDCLFGIDTNAHRVNDTVLCPTSDESISIFEEAELPLFGKIWNLDSSAPMFLILVVAPLLNFKSATFFTKFNSAGSLSVIYLFIFVVVKSTSWGINVDFTDSGTHFVNLYKRTFFAMSGMLPLSLFIHNIIITLMRNNKYQQHNSRDLSVAYILVILTYLVIGFTFYICFPLPKSCIQDNMLNNFPNWDGMTVLARVFLFFQLLTVFPLLSYMLRIQIFSALNYSSYPSTYHVVTLNAIIIAGCVLFAIFLPRIGTIIRFTGAICGFVYVFTLPCLLHMRSLQLERKLTYFSIIVHSVIPIIGLVNFIGQFFVDS